MPLEPGSLLGPYEILALLGRGGMGEAWRARDTRLDRIVAIKTLNDTVAGAPEFRERFAREARAVSALNHSNICALYDVGQEGPVSYLVMEFAAGETLSEILRKGPLPPALALQYASEVAAALDHAHRQGIVHRDLKPANIIITKNGAKLLDFGIAKLLRPQGEEVFTSGDPRHTVTAEGMVVGTLHYMAPEQLTGKPIDARPTFSRSARCCMRCSWACVPSTPTVRRRRFRRFLRASRTRSGNWRAGCRPPWSAWSAAAWRRTRTTGGRRRATCTPN